jgi:hypothetical protein
VSAQPPGSGPDPPAVPPALSPPPPPAPPGAIRCPRCSAEIALDQGWCLECGAPARTRLAPTPNWQLPTAAIGAIVLVAGALLAFAFVKLTGDDEPTPSGTAPVIATQPPAAPAPVQTTPPTTTTRTVTRTTPTQTTTAPGTTTLPPATVPGQTTPSNQRRRTAPNPRTGD